MRSLTNFNCALSFYAPSFNALIFGALTLGVFPLASVGSAQAPAEEFTLRYKLRPGEQLVSKVVHFAETRTKMSDHHESSSSRTITEKVWEVSDVNAKGEMTFEYRINAVELAQSVGDGEELSYNSVTDKQPPDVFKRVAETVAKPLAVVTINPQGQVLQRNSDLKNPQLGMGVPTIRIEPHPLTPVSSPAVESQLIQQLSKGAIKFDLDSGRMLSKELNWSDEVVGFRGPETSLRYEAKYTEELLPAAKRTASRSRN